MTIPPALTIPGNKYEQGPRALEIEVKADDSVNFTTEEVNGAFANTAPDAIPSIIGFLNAALPDGDPRKITERWVSAMRDAVETMIRDGHGKSLALVEAADALASILPPRDAS